ncbi:unnamed protein product [Ectocarpus sp. 12 AP-2014]
MPCGARWRNSRETRDWRLPRTAPASWKWSHARQLVTQRIRTRLSLSSSTSRASSLRPNNSMRGHRPHKSRYLARCIQLWLCRSTNRAVMLESQGKYDEADPLYLQAIEIAEKTLGPDHPSEATRLNNRVGLLESQGKCDEAKSLYERSLDIDENVYGPDHPNVATGLNNWAGLLESQGSMLRQTLCTSY